MRPNDSFLLSSSHPVPVCSLTSSPPFRCLLIMTLMRVPGPPRFNQVRLFQRLVSATILHLNEAEMVPVSLLLITPPISATARRPLTSGSMVESENGSMDRYWRCGQCTIQKTLKVAETSTVKAEEIGSEV